MFRKILLFIFKFFFRLKGWRIEGGISPEIKKCVICAAPHTSNWDFMYGMGALAEYGIDIKYLAKKELFRFPLKSLLLALGGIPVNRSKSNSLVSSMAEMVNSRENFHVLFPPEGTRSPVAKWKTGFYYLALETGIPIVPGYLDYKRKVSFLGAPYYPTGDIKKDFAFLSDFYKDIHPKYPENFKLPVLE